MLYVLIVNGRPVVKVLETSDKLGVQHALELAVYERVRMRVGDEIIIARYTVDRDNVKNLDKMFHITPVSVADRTFEYYSVTRATGKVGARHTIKI